MVCEFALGRDYKQSQASERKVCRPFADLPVCPAVGVTPFPFPSFPAAS